MRKTITKIICVAAAAISAAGLALASGCANWTTEGVSPDNYTTVTSNGGFAVQTDDYVYFINGSESNTADNTFGTPLKGSIQRIAKDSFINDGGVRNYAASETVVPVIAYSTHYNAGIYIYGDRIYYSTPSTARNSTGEVQNSDLEFKSSTLDGTSTMSDYYYRASSASLAYRYVEVNDVVYLLYAVSESLYGESSSVTNIHSVNTVTGTDTLLAYNVSEYAFDTQDPTNPYVFYTMGVTYLLGSNNAITEGYNQLYMVRADATQPNEYDFSYVADYNAEENPLYVNCGDLVYDGIGNLANASRYSQFNYGWTAESTPTGSPYTVDRADSTYALSYYKDGRLTFTVQQSLDSAAGLYFLDVSDVADSQSGGVVSAWNAIDANDSLINNRLLITDDEVDYTFVTLEGEDGSDEAWVLYGGDNGLELGQFVNGQLDNEFVVTDSGEPTILAVREETTANSDGDGAETDTYVYYSLSDGTGYTFYRIALNTDSDNYRPNRLPLNDKKYTEVRILDLDANSSWYMPEFVGNVILFASETEGMTDYDYIMACDLSSADGDMMSNAELEDYNDQYESISEKITDDYEDVTNSDGETDAYENLPNALRYAFYTGDSGYLEELRQAYVDIEDRDIEYLYSDESAQIYLDFCNAEGDWAEYADDVRTVNGEDVHSNRQQYYYALFGVMTEDDGEGLIESFRSTYMQAYPEDTSTWWTRMGTAWQIVFIVAMCVLGLAVIGGVAVLIIWLVRRKKNKSGGTTPERVRVDITDDKNIDVYSDEN